jgi:maleate cis-trans isomerase
LAGIGHIILRDRVIGYAAPNAEAYLAVGVPNFRRESDGLAQRFSSLEVGLEEMLGKPVVSSDNALYWRVMKTIGIAPTTKQGILLSSLIKS